MRLRRKRHHTPTWFPACRRWLLRSTMLLFLIRISRKQEILRSSLSARTRLQGYKAATSEKSVQKRVESNRTETGNQLDEKLPDLSDVGNLTLFHVGKTGGTTLRKHVLSAGCNILWNPSKRLACHEKQVGKESEFSRHTKGIIHYQQVFPSEQIAIVDAGGFVFSLREPVARFESAFRFHNPLESCAPQLQLSASCGRMKKATQDPNSFDAQYFLNCFPRLQFLSQAIADPRAFVAEHTNPINETYCLKTRNETFNKIGFSDYGHMVANYRFYESVAGRGNLTSKVVLVIRTEFLWEDVSNLDKMLGGDGDFGFISGRRETPGANKTTRPTAMKLSIEEAKPLCCMLWPEFESYKRIVEQAFNLNQQQKLDTYQLVWQRCGVSSWEEMKISCNLI